MAETLKEKTAKGLFWGAMNNGFMQVAGIAFGIVLGRLLVPEDFGLVAMIVVFSAIANVLQNSGFFVALINEKEPKESSYEAVLWFNIIMGLVLYAVLFLCAPLIANYYHEPRLVWLSRYAFLGIIVSSMGVAQAAYLYKTMKARQLAQANMVAVLVSSTVAVVMAWAGCSYWAIATQTLLFSLIATIMRWYYSDWRPKWGSADFGFIRRQLPFSVKILLSEMVTQVNNNVMNIVLGRYYGSHHTGQYNQAYQWNFKGYSLVQNMVKQVDQTVLVSLGDERERQLAVLRKMMRFTAFVSFPLLLGFGLVAKEFIVLAIGEKWLVSAGYIQTLCLSGAVLPLSALLSDLIVSHGRSDIFLYVNSGLLACQTVLLLGLHLIGCDIQTLVNGYVALMSLWIFVWHHFARRLTSYSLLMFLKDTLPFALVSAVVMGVTGYVTKGIDSLWMLLFVRIVIAVALYVLAMTVLRVKIFRECISFVKSFRNT